MSKILRPSDYNEETGEIGLKEVIQTMQLQADVTLKLRIGNETIETTAEHPFFTETGWKDAADLELTDQIQRKDNTYQPISLIEYSYLQQKVFNFEVADWHTPVQRRLRPSLSIKVTRLAPKEDTILK